MLTGLLRTEPGISLLKQATMVDATFFHVDELNDVPYLSELDAVPFWSHNEFDLYASDSEFPPSDNSLQPHSVTHEDDLSYHFDCASIAARGLDEFSDHDSISNADLFDRGNQVNFIMDLFQQRVEQSQVLGNNDSDSEALNDSIFCVVEGNSDVGIDGLGLGLGLGLGIDVDPVDCDENCVFMGGSYGLPQNIDDDDSFFERMASVSVNEERPSLIRLVQPSENGTRNVGFESDSDVEDCDVLEICISSEDEYNAHEANDDVVSMSLFQDSLQLDDYRDTNEDLEWEEVDDRVDERDVLTFYTAEDERTVSVSVSPVGETQEQEEDVSTARDGVRESLEWQVLLNTNNLDNNMDTDHAAEPYFGEQYDYFNTLEYGTMFGQFVDNENPLTGRPPAAKSVVQNLPSVVLTKEDVENDKPLCAICKEDFNVGEHAKKLACGHRYHGDCIIPWLGIRNTCPVCRYECPTDDDAWEHRRTRGSSSLRSDLLTQILFEP